MKKIRSITQGRSFKLTIYLEEEIPGEATELLKQRIIVLDTELPKGAGINGERRFTRF